MEKPRKISTPRTLNGPSGKPAVFIGSSTEGRRIAQDLQLGLAHVANCRIWTQGVFGPTQFTLEALIEQTKSSDFAILVLTPDDLAIKRGKKKSIPRDNVVFELGLFMGAIGRDRTFLVHSRDKPIELPTNLAGVTTLTFSLDGDGDLETALGEVCTRIEKMINQTSDTEEPPDDPYHRFLKLGMKTVHKNLGDIPLRLARSKTIRILKTWFPENPNVDFGLRDAIKDNDASVRLLLSDPDSELLRERSRSVGEDAEHGSKAVVRVLADLYEWGCRVRGHHPLFKLGLYDSWPGCPVIWYDEEDARWGEEKNILMGFYLRNYPSPELPWIEIDPSSDLAKTLNRQYDSLLALTTIRIADCRQLKDWLRKRGLP